MTWEKQVDEYKEGDKVELKSGGPTMTVNDISVEGDRYKCAWFGGSKLQEGWFHENALMKASEEDVDSEG